MPSALGCATRNAATMANTKLDGLAAPLNG